MRRKIIAGNWKMNKTVPEAVDFVRGLMKQASEFINCDIIVGPPYTALAPVSEVIKDSNVKLSAQNVHFEDSGAYTGEVSTGMLESAGCDLVIIGHSERRQYFGDTDELINKKLKKVLSSKLDPIFCIGETLDERKSGRTEQVVERHVKKGLDGISKSDVKRVTIAYEPVWAIGTGETATPEQAEEVHAFIRKLLKEIYDEEISEGLRIQYGGSVKPSNAKELLKQPDLDGALIGGASLDLNSFTEIIKIADRL
ncbi:triose-phosphate isomerase [candidate division KSB1 bacterium]|nr:triose-phosphate isomerase [candidate division KSB1 bacterium]